MCRDYVNGVVVDDEIERRVATHLHKHVNFTEQWIKIELSNFSGARNRTSTRSFTSGKYNTTYFQWGRTDNIIAMNPLSDVICCVDKCGELGKHITPLCWSENRMIIPLWIVYWIICMSCYTQPHFIRLCDCFRPWSSTYVYFIKKKQSASVI